MASKRAKELKKTRSEVFSPVLLDKEVISELQNERGRESRRYTKINAPHNELEVPPFLPPF